MKRISALICAMMLVLTVLAPACFAANESANSEQTDFMKIVESSPADGTEGVAVDNLSIKIQFDKAVKPDGEDATKTRTNNAKKFKLVDEDNKSIPLKIYYSDETEGLILVAADVVDAGKDGQIKSDMTYKLTIDKTFASTDGCTLADNATISVKTLNQTRSTIIYTALMVLMMGGMVVFTVRSTKKAQEKEEEEKNAKNKPAGLNPYKEAKKTGKTVAEVVETENKKKRKQLEAEAKRKEELEALEAKIMEELRRERNKRVSKPRPISAAGSTYKVEVKTTKKEAPAKKANKNTGNSGGGHSHGYNKKHKK